MKKVVLSLYCLFFALALFAQEKQVPFFIESNIYTIDKKMANKIQLFQEYENFESASLFLLENGNYILEIFYLEEGSRTRKNISLSPEKKEELIAEIRQKMALQNKSFDLNQTGRTALMIGASAVGLGYYGWAVPGMLDIQDEKSYIASYMFSAGLGFVLPYVFTKNIEVSRQQASLTFYGQVRGALTGTYLSFILDEDAETELIFGLGTLFSICGGITGFHLAKQWDYSRGQISTLQLGGDLGSIYGSLTAEVFDFWEDDKTRPATSSILLGSALGLVAGKYWANQNYYSLGDAISLRTSIAIGSLFAINIVDFFEPEEFKPYSFAGMIGMAAGGLVGHYFNQGQGFSTSKGILISLGGITGGLIGLGGGYLISPDDQNSDPSSYLLTGASIGAIAGYAIMYSQLSKRLEIDSKKEVVMNMSFNPVALLNFKNTELLKNPYYTNELCRLSLRF